MVMLKAAIALIQHLNDQLIAVPCRRVASHQRASGSADRFDVIDEGPGPVHRR